MFFLKIAEALIANQEANLATDTNSNHTNNWNINDQISIQKQPEKPISMSPGMADNSMNPHRSSSIDNHVPRSLLSQGSDSSSKSSYFLSNSPIYSKQSSHSLPISPNESPSITSVSSSPPGGLLYSLLVSNSSHSSDTNQTSPRHMRKDKQIVDMPTDLIIHQPKKYKLAEEVTEKESSSWRSIFPRSSSDGPRRFSFGGYSAPRGERITAILHGPATAPTSYKHENNSPYHQAVSSVSSLEVPLSNSTPSILSALISSPCLEWSAGLSSASTDSGLDEPLDLTSSLAQNAEDLKHRENPAPVVQLAKKTARPVQARVSEWLRQAAEFVLSSAQAVTPKQDMWLAMFRATWHRLLALSMAEHSLDVVVVEHAHSGEQQTAGEQILPWLLSNQLLTATDTACNLPDRKFAGQLLQCLTELRAQQLTSEEFSMIRHTILLTAEQPLAIPAMGVKVIQSARLTSSRLQQPPVNCNTSSEEYSDVDELGSEFGLTALARGLVALSKLCPSRMAGLFCTHLRGDNSLKSILPTIFRPNHYTLSTSVAFPSPAPVRRESILSSLIRSSPIPHTSLLLSSNSPHPSSSIKSKT